MRKIVLLAACAVSVLALRADYRPEPWNLEARQKFAEQRFGIFIHWGLIDSYHPGNIWFDGEWEHASRKDDGTWERTLDWEFDDIYDLIHAKKTLVANNNHQPIRAKEDIQLFDFSTRRWISLRSS